MKRALVSTSIATLLAAGHIPAQAQENLIYVPVEPCRLSRAAIPANGTGDFLAYGDGAAIGGQGGNTAGCAHPRADSTPVAIAANFTAVGNQASGDGNLVAYAFGDTAPEASLINYKVGTNIANSSIIPLCEGNTCTSDFTIRSNFASVPAIVDVQGYFYPTAGTCPDDMVAAGSICVDKYEASLVDASGAPATSDDCSTDGSDCAAIFAQSVAGVLPATEATWFQAAAACANVGKRLPTVAEWQMAALGTPTDGINCNTSGGSLANTGSSTQCVSTAGAFDMVGNLWEWTADLTPAGSSAETSTVAVFGESWAGNIDPTPGPDSMFVPSNGPVGTNPIFGFRCVR